MNSHSIDTSVLSSFQPETVIEIDDKLTNSRKLAIVNDSQFAYFDLDDHQDNFFPIYANENPVDLGNPNIWSSILFQEGEASGDFAPYFAFRVLRTEAIERVDYLTFVRAAWWAYSNRNFDIAAAIKAGQEATNAVIGSRDIFDNMLSLVISAPEASHGHSAH